MTAKPPTCEPGYVVKLRSTSVELADFSGPTGAHRIEIYSGLSVDLYMVLFTPTGQYNHNW